MRRGCKDLERGGVYCMVCGIYWRGKKQGVEKSRGLTRVAKMQASGVLRRVCLRAQ